MNLTTPQRIGIFAALAALMALTRFAHFALLPDASWAVFFIAGFYLRNHLRVVLPALLGLAVAIDYIVISSQGIPFWSHYCASPAYWFLAAAYASMWFGGSWLRAHHDGANVNAALRLGAAVLASASMCFVISNGSFYWLSGTVAAPSMAGWLTNMSHWFMPYLGSSALWVGAAAVVHLLVAADAGRVPARRGAH